MTYHVAIVGAGPAGFYVAKALLARDDLDAYVDIYDRLPTPWGLVRSGVAPDHPKIKSVSAQFDKIARHPRARYIGNVHVGSDIRREDLLASYSQIVYTTGMDHDRALGIPGEDLPGCYGSLKFVRWYNGHPDAHGLRPNLDIRHAVVIGGGNVALDVARLLAKPVSQLRATDIADGALESLTASKINEVSIAVRRGPADALFDHSELRELVSTPTVSTRLSEPVGATGHHTPEIARRLDALNGCNTSAELSPGRVIELRFHRFPVEIRGDGRVEEIEFGINSTTVDDDGRRHTSDTGMRETYPAGLVVSAIGFHGTELAGLPFDSSSGTIPNKEGKILGTDREFVAGWIKRGPVGTIGLNKRDASETVRAMVDDFGPVGEYRVGSNPPSTWPQSNILPAAHVDQNGWERINSYEIAEGMRCGRPRVKLATAEELIQVARTTE